MCLVGTSASKSGLGDEGPRSGVASPGGPAEAAESERPSKVRVIAIDDDDDEDDIPPAAMSASRPTSNTDTFDNPPGETPDGDVRSSKRRSHADVERRGSLVKRRRLGESDSEEIEVEEEKDRAENDDDNGDDEDVALSSEDEEAGSEEDSVEDDGYSLYWRVDNAHQRDKEVIDCSAEKNLRIEDYFERYIEMMARVHTDREALRVWWQNPRGKEAVRFTTAARKVRSKVIV